MATGTVILDFGPFPGKSNASVAVASPTIVAGSLVEAWIRPVATADHTADEHMLETLKVFAADIVAGVGFTVHGFNTSELVQRAPDNLQLGNTNSATRTAGWGPLRKENPNAGEDPDRDTNRGTLIYGQWTIAWAWV
jgi:hypothetical protein